MALTNAEKQARWRAAHPEKAKERNAAYWSAHKEKYNSRKRERYAQQKQTGGK